MPTASTNAILLSVAGIWTLAVMTPGPNFFLTVQIAVSRSRSAALWSVLGTSCGTVAWGLSGFFGIAVLFRTAPWLYGALKLLGGGYLVYLGLRLLVQKSTDPAPAFILQGAPPNRRESWRAGLLTNLSNPKTAAFVTSLFAASMPAATPVWLGLISVGLMAGLSLMWYTIVACLFSLAPCTALYQRGRRWIDRSAGLIFILFGTRLAANR
jgi:threonine/homoserine/homoserine lactone efflux protein